MQIEQVIPPGEEIVVRCHPHPWVLLGAGLRSLGIGSVGVAVLWGSAYLPTGSSAIARWSQAGQPWVEGAGRGLLVLSLGWLLGALLSWRRTEYAVTQLTNPGAGGGSLLVVRGLIPHLGITMLAEVNTLRLDGSLLGQVLGYATIRVLTGNDQVQELRAVPQAQQFYRACEQGRLQGYRGITGPQIGPLPEQQW